MIINANTDVFTPGSFNKPPYYPGASKKLVVKKVKVKVLDGVMVPLSRNKNYVSYLKAQSDD